MKPNMNNSNPYNGIFNQLAASKKKAAVAGCLIALMAFMWLRVIRKKTPQPAQATLLAQAGPHTSNAEPTLKISFIQLPNLPGRNDSITRDFFDSHDWRHFIKNAKKRKTTGPEEVNNSSYGDREKITKRIAEKLKLQAIAFGSNPQAFINDKPLSIGDKLLIADAAENRICEVVAIQKQSVSIRCAEVEITLKLEENP